MSVPGIDGVAVVVDWSELAPAGPDAYDFSALDRWIAAAESHHLAVELVIKAGKGVPSWIFEPAPSSAGASRLDFVYSHHNGVGPCTPVAMPPPWDPTYQSAFARMLGRVAAHLQETGAIRAVSVVKLTGMNTQSEEMRLPAQTPEETKRSCVTNAIQTWLSVGYRPALVSEAFDGIIASFATAFPGTFFTLPIILTNGFPPIGDTGVAIPRGRARASNARLLDALLRSAATRLPNRLILQQDFLVADQPARARTIELSAANGLPVAWQTNLFFGGDAKGAGCGGRISTARPCDNASYLRLLQNGIVPEGGHGPNARARYIEVFPFDALAFPAAVETAHRALVE